MSETPYALFRAAVETLLHHPARRVFTLIGAEGAAGSLLDGWAEARARSWSARRGEPCEGSWVRVSVRSGGPGGPAYRLESQSPKLPRLLWGAEELRNLEAPHPLLLRCAPSPEELGGRLPPWMIRAAVDLGRGGPGGAGGEEPLDQCLYWHLPHPAQFLDFFNGTTSTAGEWLPPPLVAPQRTLEDLALDQARLLGQGLWEQVGGQGALLALGLRLRESMAEEQVFWALSEELLRAVHLAGALQEDLRAMVKVEETLPLSSWDRRFSRDLVARAIYAGLLCPHFTAEEYRSLVPEGLDGLQPVSLLNVNFLDGHSKLPYRVLPLGREALRRLLSSP